MSDLRILVVEDDLELLKMIVDSLSNKKKQIWANILRSQYNKFDDLIVSSAPTITAAQSLIKGHPRFHLFILDISVKAGESSAIQGNGLELIRYAISVEKKPSAIVSLTGTSMDAGRNTIQQYYKESSYACLSKFSNPQDTVNGFVNYLTQEVQTNELSMPRILSLCLPQGRVTIIFGGMEANVPIIKLRFSEIAQAFTVNHERSRIFLYHLGWVASNHIIKYEHVAELLGMKTKKGIISKDQNAVSSEISKIGDAIIKLIDLGDDKDFVKKYIFSNYRGVGYRLVDSIILETVPYAMFN